MNAAQLRRLVTRIHLVTSLAIGYYVYSPIHEHPTLQMIGRWVAFPIMAITGVTMWQWGRIRKAQKRAKEASQA